MSRNLYIADLHLGHQNCIGFDGRPFSSIDEHDKALVTNWNAVVMPDTSGRRNMKAVSRALMIFSRSVICCTAVQWK